jgi:CelD/BcsL family acetyltransferase involved in cellulose biosynthesis
LNTRTSDAKGPAVVDRSYRDLGWEQVSQSVFDEWSRIVSDKGLNPSLDPKWIACAAESHGVTKLRVFAAFERDVLTGVIPYFVERTSDWGVPVNRLNLATNIASYHVDVVSRGNADDMVCAWFDAGPRWDVARMDGLAEDSALSSVLSRVARDRRIPLIAQTAELSPFVPIRSSWAEFIRSRNKKFRYKLRKREESLDGRTLRLEWFTDADRVHDLFDAMLAVESKSWKAARGVAVASDSVESRYYARLLPYIAERGYLEASVVYSLDRPIAYSLCCRAGQWCGQLKTSFDESFDALSPGGIAIDASLRKAFEAGVAEFDFLGDSGEHKMAWTDVARQHVDFFLFSRSIRGRALGAAKTFKRAVTRGN